MKEVVRLTIDTKDKLPETFKTVEDSMSFLAYIETEEELKNYAATLKKSLIEENYRK